MKTIIVVKQQDKPLRCFTNLSIACKRLKIKVKPQTIRNAISEAKPKTNSYVTGGIELTRIDVER